MERGIARRRSNARFEEFIGVFIAAGKPLNAGDVMGAKVLWPLLNFEDRAKADICHREATTGDRAPQFHAAAPVNFLRAKPLDSCGTVADAPYDKPSKILDRLDRAAQYLPRTPAETIRQ